MEERNLEIKVGILVLVAGALPPSEMASLSQDRPVFVEPDPFLEKAHIQYLEPHGVFMAFRPEPVARGEVSIIRS